MRAVLLAVLVVLACTLTVSASSADWSAPEALWSSDLSASELEARHSEFLMATEASSTGPANYSSSSSSSSTGPDYIPLPVVEMAPITMALNLDISTCAEGDSAGACAFTPKAITNTISQVFGFPDPDLPGEAFVANVTSAVGASASSSGAAGESTSTADAAAAAPARRLLQAASTDASFNFIGSPKDGGIHARKIYAAFAESLKCSDVACQDAVQAKYSLPSSLSASPISQIATIIVPNSLVVDDAAVQQGSNDALGANAADREVRTVGGPRKTNIGYYVLGAVLLAFIVAALVYFIVHKKPVETIVKEEPLRRDEVAMAPVVAAPVAHNSGVVVAEEQPLAGGQQQMDYRSVFALKHNVLDKSAEQKAAEEDEHNHNDVHFILHQ